MNGKTLLGEREMRFYVFHSITGANAQQTTTCDCDRFMTASCTTHARDYYFDLCACYMFSLANRHYALSLSLSLSRNGEKRTETGIPNAKLHTQFFIQWSHTLYLVFQSGQHDCGAMAIIASLKCSISTRFHWMCIGTLLTKLIRTYVQLILFLRVANQLHIAFDKQMKESPINWRVTQNKCIKLGHCMALCHVKMWSTGFILAFVIFSFPSHSTLEMNVFIDLAFENGSASWSVKWIVKNLINCFYFKSHQLQPRQHISFHSFIKLKNCFYQFLLLFKNNFGWEKVCFYLRFMKHSINPHSLFHNDTNISTFRGFDCIFWIEFVIFISQ